MYFTKEARDLTLLLSLNLFQNCKLQFCFNHSERVFDDVALAENYNGNDIISTRLYPFCPSPFYFPFLLILFLFASSPRWYMITWVHTPTWWYRAEPSLTSSLIFTDDMKNLHVAAYHYRIRTRRQLKWRAPTCVPHSQRMI